MRYKHSAARLFGRGLKKSYFVVINHEYFQMIKNP